MTAMPELARSFRLVLGLLLTLVAATAQTKLLRFPDIHGERIAFSYGGDLWIVAASGGQASRLTAHPGIEVFPKFSPDGKWIAFTGQYDGDEQVYVMPSAGGEPRQLTFYPARGPLTPRWGYDNQVVGWSNDGRYVIFRSLRDSWTLSISRLYRVPVDGGPAEALPMPVSGAGSYSPGGNQIVYSPQARDFRPEKRYSGGQANVLYVFDTETHEAKRITEGPRATRDPMWIGKQIFYDSDRDGHFNLYAYDTGTGKTTQVTRFTASDVRWPSSDRERRVVFELDGELQVLDVKTGQAKAIAVTVPDDGINRRSTWISAANLIGHFGISPKGERVLFAARGDIFTAPVEKGTARNLTRSPGAHDKWPAWSHDGTKVAYISDVSGEEEIYVVPQEGFAPAERITSGGKVFRYQPKWAPDDQRIAFSDKDGKLWVINLADKKLQEIAHSVDGEIRDYEWSPGGGYLAFSMNTPGRSQFSALYICSLADGKVQKVTSGLGNENSPTWDPAGDYLYFLAVHEFRPQISQIEFDFAANRSSGIYALALRKDVKNPFPPENDEVATAKPGAKDESKKEEGKKDEEKKDEAKAPPKDKGIDFEGLGQRVTAVPVEANNYAGLDAKTGGLLYIVYPAPYYGRQATTKPSLRFYSIKDRKETVLAEDANGYALSYDGSKVLVRQPDQWNVYEATATGTSTKKTVSTSGLMLERVPAAEWAQIFNEVWRRYRDFFYDPNMHGYDWEAVREKYAKLLPYVAHRSDLNYVIGEMISELTVQHAYIAGGDFQAPARPHAGLPGARFSADQASGRYRIASIFSGQNEEAIYRSPLTEVGVDAAVGDYVLAINGEEVTTKEDIYKWLRHAGDAPVQLTLNRTPSLDGARKVTYRPIGSESDLSYRAWVEGNRRRVDELSGGRIGYMHLPNMGEEGIREFIKWYYPQFDKEALLIDDRANGGGNISRMVIVRLTRTLLGVDFSRTRLTAEAYPDSVFLGPKLVLIDGNSASDGDIFPWMFRSAGLGPLLGERTWGGVVGITDHGSLMDGGSVNVPEFAYAKPNGEWAIEGHGVDPDIPVVNDAKSVIDGHDPQLERGVAELLKKLPGATTKLPAHAPYPVKLK
jgi:tricorn protease